MKDEKLLAEARKRFEIVHSWNFDNRESFKKNMKFSFNVDSGHWNEADIEARTKEKRPYITAHKLGKFVSQVVNEERGAVDRDLVIPVDSAGDINVAKVYNNIIEDIQYKSEYDEVIQMAGEHAIGGGFGYWRLLTEYCDDGFDQEIKIKPIINPLNVDIDPKGRYAFIREGLTMDEVREMYPKHAETITSFATSEDEELWYEEDKVFIAEYYRKVPYQKTIAEVDKGDGTTMVVDITEGKSDFRVLRERTLTSDKVEWYKISGHVVLERGEWVGSEIPIIEVDGQKVYLEGRTYKKALTSDAQSMNQAYNYWFTSLTEKIALSPKAPYVVTAQQIKGHEDEWQDANVKNRPYLTVNQTNAGIPQRTPAPEVGQGELLMLNLCDQNIKDVLGMYETSVGMTSNERSGKAIQARAARSALGTYHFPDNLRKAKAKTKRMMIEIIPKIYDNARVMRLVGRKDMIPINFEKWDSERNETVKINDLSVGKYDLRETRPMNPSIRQMAVDDLREAMQYAPMFADILLPLFLSYTDVPGLQEAVKAIKARQQTIEKQKQAEISAKTGGMPQGLPDMPQ